MRTITSTSKRLKRAIQAAYLYRLLIGYLHLPSANPDAFHAINYISQNDILIDFILN